MNAKPSNAITMLKKHHKDVKALFKQFEGLTDCSLAGKKKIVGQICDTLIVLP